MSASNPRKFSEKIAIQQRKAAEEEKQFEKIMEEVNMVKQPPRAIRNQPISALVPMPPGGVGPPNMWLIPGSGSFRPGGSLPNVNQLTQSHIPIQMPAYDMPMNCHFPPQAGPVHPRGRSPGAHGHGSFYHPYRNHSPHTMAGSVSPGRYPSTERQGDMQLYGSPQAPAYLCPPADANWRRTNSDPGIHASSTLMQPNMPGSSGSQPHSPPQHSSPQRTSPGASPALGLMTFDTNMGGMPGEAYGLYADQLQPQVGVNNTGGSLPDLAASCLGPSQVPSHQHARQQEEQQRRLSQQEGMYPGYMSGTMITSGTQHQPFQQRHSVQLPVTAYTHYISQNASPASVSDYSLGSYRSPDQVRSAPTSPAQDSPVASPVGAGSGQSPGSPYSYLNTEMSKISVQGNMDTFPVNSYGQGSYCEGSASHSPYQTTFSVARQQSISSPGHGTLSPQSSQIPDIVLTGVDSNTMDIPFEINELLCAVCMDPNDLEHLHMDPSLHIDAATEERLRH